MGYGSQASDSGQTLLYLLRCTEASPRSGRNHLISKCKRSKCGKDTRKWWRLSFLIWTQFYRADTAISGQPAPTLSDYFESSEEAVRHYDIRNKSRSGRYQSIRPSGRRFIHHVVFPVAGIAVLTEKRPDVVHKMAPLAYIACHDQRCSTERTCTYRRYTPHRIYSRASYIGR